MLHVQCGTLDAIDESNDPQDETMKHQCTCEFSVYPCKKTEW